MVRLGKCDMLHIMPFLNRALPLLAFLLFVSTRSSRAEVQWPQLKYTVVANVHAPTCIANAGDGSNRLFLVSQHGVILISQNEQLLPTPFLDIRSRVSADNERGLFSIAFPPGYATKRYFYVTYARPSDGAFVLSRFHVAAGTPNVSKSSSEQVLLVVAHPESNHYGGQLNFGPDGYLYCSLGDGGSFGDPDNNAQNPDVLLGKLLRLDTESGISPYAIPPTNPFVGKAGYRPEIWALGLRNPWRFSFDQATGDLYLPDVGEWAWEEINFLAAGQAGGQNYGWRILEGTYPYNVPPGTDTSVLTAPVIEYSHEIGSSITGGFVYRGPASRMSGLYIYADFTSSKIFGAVRTGGTWVTQMLDSNRHYISSFGQSETGQLYATNYVTGDISLIEEDSTSHIPTLTPAGGTYSNDQLVKASSTTPNAILHYTTNGSDPTGNDPVFPAEGLFLDAPATLKVKAFHAYYQPSASQSGTYDFMVAAPQFGQNSSYVYPSTGLYVLVFSATTNAVIHYTLDGSVPTSESTIYGPNRIHLALGPVTIRAIAIKPNYRTSAESSKLYPRPDLPIPRINPYNGRVYKGDAVSISGFSGTHYTLDGSAPTESSRLYTGPFHVTSPALLRVKGFSYGYNPSLEVSVNLFLYYQESGSNTAGSGSGTAGYADASFFYDAQYRSPEALCIDGSGNIYIADTGNHTIRKTTAFGPVSTLAGNGTAGLVNAQKTSARFSSPRGICCDKNGNLYVADDGNHVIRKIDTLGNVTTYAGSGISGSNDGPGPQAQFLALQGLQMDVAGNLYVGSEGVIRKIDPQRNVSTFATLPNAGRVSVAIKPDGTLFATDSSAKVYQVSSTGVVTVYAGGGVGFSDGDRLNAWFQTNRAVAADALGNLYLCDGNGVRKIRPDGSVYTMIDPSAGGSLSSPRGICVASNGHVWIADTDNHRIRRAYANDWDDDGIPDTSEGGTTPFIIGVNDKEVDTDQDGQSNSSEYTSGTDPRDAKSRFEIRSVTVNASNQVLIQWQSVVGKKYTLYSSEDLKTWKFFDGYIYSGNGGVLSATQYLIGKKSVFYKITVR